MRNVSMSCRPPTGEDREINNQKENIHSGVRKKSEIEHVGQSGVIQGRISCKKCITILAVYLIEDSITENK